MTGNRFRSFRIIFNVSIQAYAATATPAKGDISIKSKRGHFHKVATFLKTVLDPALPRPYSREQLMNALLNVGSPCVIVVSDGHAAGGCRT
jgi:hypothetical protein